jgi:hypothetical protein
MLDQTISHHKIIKNSVRAPAKRNHHSELFLVTPESIEQTSSNDNAQNLLIKKLIFAKMPPGNFPKVLSFRELDGD